MTIPGSANPLLLASAASTGYSISRSLRFNSSDSAYLSRAVSTAGNRKKWTLAFWYKKTQSGTTLDYVFGSSNDGFNSNYALLTLGTQFEWQEVASGSTTVRKTLAPLIRDHSAWMHVVVVFDTDNATPADRTRFYLNGVRITDFSPHNTNPSSGYQGLINQNYTHYFGYTSSSFTANGYFADMYFVDGLALEASSFGEFDATTGVWNPKTPTDITPYGTNGFHLDFADNSAATAAALGKDTSGNGNNWTPNNLSVTAGAGNDSLVDVPTNGAQTDTGVGGEVRGNYCTLNLLDQKSATLTNGNLDVSISASSSGVNPYASGSIAPSSGKWYFEGTYTSSTLNAAFVGVLRGADFNTYIGSTGVGYYGFNGQKVVDGSYTSYGNSFTAGDVIGVALDLDSGTVTFYKNNTSQGAITLPSSSSGWKAYVGNGASSGAQGFTLNFGQRPFAYTAPSGLKALCTANLPAPLVTKPSSHFQVVTDTGANIRSTAEALTFGADLIWIKDRANSSTNHQLLDTTRGGNAIISTSSDAAEGTYSAPSGNSVAWCWNESVTAGFDIVGYAGDNTSNRNISHSLGVAVDMAWIKSRSSGSFYIWHRSLASTTHFLKCNQTDGTASSTNTNSPFGTGNWSSTQFMVTNNATNNLNAASTNYIAYLWSTVVGYSSMGSYVGDGSTSGFGPFIHCGFRPKFVLIKGSSVAYDWLILDAVRNPYNLTTQVLYANSSIAEMTNNGTGSGGYESIDILSNGFQIKSNSARYNQSGATYIYFAVAESPFSIARAR